MTTKERVRLTATDFSGREQVIEADANWYGQDLTIVWQWTPGNPGKPLKTLIVQDARELATRLREDAPWELAGKYIYPGYFG